MRRTCRPSRRMRRAGCCANLRDDWRALLARAEAETTELNRMEGYAGS